MSDLRASLVIPCFNSATTVANTLAAVNRLQGRDAIDVIVVDNGSTDGSAAVARQFEGVTVLHCDARGVGNARSYGLSRARAGLLLSLDADCVPADDWAELLLNALESAGSEVIGVGGRTVPRPNPDRWSQRPEITPHPAFGAAGEPLYVVAGNACYRAGPVAELGGFPPFGADDAALGVLARRAGLGFAYAPAAIVEHSNPVGRAGYIRQMAKIGGYTGQLDPTGIGRTSWWWARARQAAGAFRRERDLEARSVCAVAAIASAHGAVRAARARDRPTLDGRPPLTLVDP